MRKNYGKRFTESVDRIISEFRDIESDSFSCRVANYIKFTDYLKEKRTFLRIKRYKISKLLVDRSDKTETRIFYSEKRKINKLYKIYTSAYHRIILVYESLLQQAIEEQEYLLCKKDDIDKYRYQCRFIVEKNIISHIKGYDLLLEYGWYNRETNLNGVVKDHRVSVKYGFDNRISPDIIGHSVNCEFLLNMDNLSKSSKCSISLEQLMKEIRVRGNNPIVR